MIISIQAGDLVNPIPKTAFRQRMEDKKESEYLSKKKAPLGEVLLFYVWSNIVRKLSSAGLEVTEKDMACQSNFFWQVK